MLPQHGPSVVDQQLVSRSVLLLFGHLLFSAGASTDFTYPAVRVSQLDLIFNSFKQPLLAELSLGDVARRQFLDSRWL